MNENVLRRFKHYFQSLTLEDVSVLDDIYTDTIHFQDPVHQIEGINNLKQYFSRLNKNLVEGAFEFTDEAVSGDKAFLSWEMTLMLKKPKKKIYASGFSVLVIREKVVYQRDYFDAGELFYEHIPVLGSIIKLVKKQIAQ